MDLSQAQVDAYQREGFLVIERVISPAEMAVLEATLPEITDPTRGKVDFDEVSGAIRVSQGAHLYNETFRRLTLHPRLVRPAQQLLGTAFHVYQSRLTIKPGLVSVPASGWDWHQDFSTWHLGDGMPEPRALVTFTFLDDVTAANAPVLVIPRSHHQGLIGTMVDEDPDDPGYRDVEIMPGQVRELAQRGGVTALTGPVGTVAFMHCAMVHASAANIAPLRRALFAVVFNPVDNRARHPRPKGEHWISTNVEPVRPLADDCLLTMAS
jgi:L-proline 4-hydroxylase